ncbi:MULTISPECIES: hypothetical protein [Pseudomonas]|uniref:hypothetical protein n=1 Tax=Pseudomonas TaxID=286 RepID=UPI00191BC9CA|nr:MULTISPECIES: hypothetical protein [Pseudomonas]MCM3893370.1 hypothetical protein [Pseudomonas aeruginosa]MCM3944202.1 hypothetical protein [Pseudomonas aeruginosa]MCM3951189.1 hypothetical protein [Pseudomonas aeruginosa]MCM3962252.1 hypothetical protein [Pseudomonas aeruginosa]MCM3968404.1 hypothetical protein [Pseudomonas aeruginosa]
MKNPIQTQQTRARKEFKALGRAEKNGVTDAEIVLEMVKDMANPGSAQSVMQAAAAVMYMSAVKKGDTPITEAVNRCLERQRKEKASTRAVPSPA